MLLSDWMKYPNLFFVKIMKVTRQNTSAKIVYLQ